MSEANVKRVVSADVVLAALDAIQEVAGDREQLQSVRLSIVRRRVVNLQRNIEQQATDAAE